MERDDTIVLSVLTVVKLALARIVQDNAEYGSAEFAPVTPSQSFN